MIFMDKTTPVPAVQNKTKGIIQYAKQKQENARNKALKELRRMVKNNEKVTIYRLSKLTKCSRTFLTNDPIVRKEIEKYRQQNQNHENTTESKDVINKSLRLYIRRLEEKLKRYETENGETYKQKYLEELKKNEILNQQIRSFYTEQKKSQFA